MSNLKRDISNWTGESRLVEWLEHHFGVRMTSAEPCKGVLKCTTDLGTVALKRVRDGEKKRWYFVTDVAEHVGKVKPQHPRIPSPILTRSHKPYFDGFCHSYVLLPWIEANPISLKSADDWKQASKGIAHFHQYTRGFVPHQRDRMFERIGKWSNDWNRFYQRAEVFRLAAQWTDTPSEVDQLWLDSSAYITGLMENVLQYYEQLDGDTLCLQVAEHGKVCHNNLSRHHLLLDEHEHIHLIDWNECNSDVRAKDLASWLLYAYGQTGSRSVLEAVLKGYQDISPLDESEYALIYASLLFPEKLYQVLSAIYDQEAISLHTATQPIQWATMIEEKKVKLIGLFSDIARDCFAKTIPEIDWMTAR
ncbi:phosphotransferase [Hazenella coriacea]|uniref:CotS family spore coat protein n=1 Tax=Hazenella coriacea TaxID=1179467 RepID=A0A4R3LHB7_9BACL|nr:phosphotransferase [Hazenella coriacea]TCS96916.1 CotS family spore coat protein [Hazenella coriacea]